MPKAPVGSLTLCAPVRAVFIEDRIHCYGPDLCRKLRYRSLADLAEATPRGTASVVELGELVPGSGDPLDREHPLHGIRATADPSVWINLPGMVTLCRCSPHPQATDFANWVNDCNTLASILAAPPELLDQGLHLLAKALGPSAQILAALHNLNTHGRSDLAGQALDPPALLDLPDLIGWCLGDEAFLTKVTA